MLVLTKMEKGIAVRSALPLAILSVLAVLFMKDRWTVLAGIAAGSLISHIRFHILVRSMEKLLRANTGNTVIKVILLYVMWLMLLAPVLIASLLYSLPFFLGIAAGILLVPLTITVFGAIGKLGLSLSAND